MVNNILISTYDKADLINFSQILIQKYNAEIYATDIVYDYLTGNGISVQKYNPNINIDFNMVICNFFPFEKFINKNIDYDEVFKNIDTIGLYQLQIAAKNYQKTIAISSKQQYPFIIEKIDKNELNEEFSLFLAKEAFFTICKINGLLTRILDQDNDYKIISEKKLTNLLHGENPHQKAQLYSGNILSYEVIANKELTYNNLCDMNTAVAICSEFYDVCAAVIVKNSMPFGIALGTAVDEAYLKAVDCDPVNIFDAAIAFTKQINVNTAKKLASAHVKIVIAPNFDEDTANILLDANIKLIKLITPLKDYKTFLDKEIKVTPFGILVQNCDKSILEKNSFKVVSKKKPTTEMIEDMVFAWKIIKHARSKAAVVVKDLKTAGIAQGHGNLRDAIDIALDKACENSKDAILVTDYTISLKNEISDAAQARIAAIIQPGNSCNDAEIAATADKYELVMVQTGIRQLKHF